MPKNLTRAQLDKLKEFDDAVTDKQTAKKKKFFKILKQAVEKIPFPDDCSEYILEDDYNEAKNAFYARLEDYFAEFM